MEYNPHSRSDDGYALKEVTMATAADLVCHEYTHAVVACETELVNNNQGISRSINEAYADMGACLYDQNWEYCESITERNRPMRSISNPNKTKCAALYNKSDKYYKDFADTIFSDYNCYANSVIISHALYLMNTKYKIPFNQLRKIWYYTLKMGYRGNSDFYDVRTQFIKAAKKYKNKKSIQNIKKAFDDVCVTKETAMVSYKDYQKEADQSLYCTSYFCDEITLSGKVVVADGDMFDGNNVSLKDVHIDTLSLEDQECLSSDVSDEDGCYGMDLPVCDEYILQFTCDDFLDTDMYVSDINELVQTKYYCDTVEMIPESMSGVGDASGRIKDSTSGGGVKNLSLKIRKGINNIYTDEVMETVTDYNGMYYLWGMEAGNYCVEVVCDEDSDYISSYFNIKVIGEEIVRNQDGIVSQKLEAGQIRVVLTWGSIPADLDSHMICCLQDREFEVSYKEQEFMDSGELICALDIDEMESYGPETITLYSDETGDYTYFVHNYSKETAMGKSNACVKVYADGEAYPKYTFHIPKDKKNDWNVFKYSSATGRLEVLY